MKGAVILATTILIGLLTIYNIQGQTQPQHLQRVTPNPEKCTKQLEIECGIEVKKTIQVCAKAFETEGADVIADIKCAKDLLADRKLCWPCICAAAEEEHWHVIGC